ncbi:HDOD domain-containing protein [Desulfatibacillum aliphaticivorans]|uniref:Signal transduction protein n=1 Tax=Desulfatibacillum aliphaticivorans TaxID=218208 RepID=B8FL16_DESAL|nr:HDOD domain-containing protein [Desulfatibacillum aliphaticivorans]ACL04651.1 putative signal transduction protein [Desulfatibacillum aliphaticivorans]
MKIECSSCHKKYNIPDEKLPKDKSISLKCPACQNLITINPPAQAPPINTLPEGEALKKAIVKGVKDLPPMPQVIHKARKVMADPNSSFQDLAIVLVTDQAIAAKVLKIANSPFYGLSGTVSTIQQASVVLGQKTLNEILTMASASQLLDKPMPGYGMDPGEFWRHSLLVAFGARIITGRAKPHLAEDAFAAGLTHDAGKLALEPYVAERKEMFRRLASGGMSFLEAEKAILGFDHCEIASEVCKSWKMPENITTAIRYHHYPSRSEGDFLSYALHIADTLALNCSLDFSFDDVESSFEDGALEFLDLTQEEALKIEALMLESVQKTTETIQAE